MVRDRHRFAQGMTATLRITGLSKEFPGTRALSDVDLDVLPGEIHALCGGNGSGKSTLIKVLCGVHQGDDGGHIVCGGIQARPDQMTPTIAQQMGVKVVHQDLGVFPDLTVAENLCIGSGFDTARSGRIRWRRVRSRAEELIERFEIPARPRTLLRSLSRAAQTQVAIARALRDQESERGGILILDEPTAALPAHEVELLTDSLRRYAREGQSILYVSHRLDEILDFTDRVSILRDGEKTGTWPTSELDKDKLIELIVGRHLQEVRPDRPRQADRSPVIEIEDLRAGPLKGVDLRVERGEIVGIAGLLGSGRSELLHAIFGDLPVARGSMRLDGRPVRFTHPRQAMKAGIALVPENRATDSAFLDLPVHTNMAMSVMGSYWQGLHMRDRKIRQDGTELLTTFGVKAASASAPLNTLSGGNQQKVIMARWLRRRPQLLLLDEPTQGVDVGARADIYKMVRDAVADGAGALVVASDFEELVRVVDRVVVLRAGSVVAEVARENLTVRRLTELSYEEDERQPHGH